MKRNQKKNSRQKGAEKTSQKPTAAKLAAVFTKKRVILGAVALVLAIAAFFGILVAVNAYRNSGSGIRDTVILKSEHFELTVPMFSYYVRLMGIEKENYLDHTEALMEKMTVYEAAVADGTTFDEQVKSQVDQKMQLIAYDAEKEKMELDEYLSLTYGRGVKASDIRAFEQMLTVSRLKGEQLMKEIAADEEALKQYCKENADDYLFCDFLVPILEVPFTEKMTAEEKEALVSEYEGYANDMAKSKSEKELLEKYVIYLNKIQNAKEEDELTEKNIATILEDAEFTRQPYKDSLNSRFEIDTWLFSTDRQPGDCKVNKGGSIDKSVTFGVYYMTRPLYTNDDLTHTVYDILVPFSVYTETAAESNVKKVAEIYKSAPTEETLGSLAAQYRGGLAENYITALSSEEELTLWLAEERAKGDVLTYQGEDGWHFVCYMEKGLPECYAQAKQILDNKALTAKQESIAKEHRVSMDTAGFKEIPPLKYGWLIF